MVLTLEMKCLLLKTAMSILISLGLLLWMTYLEGELLFSNSSSSLRSKLRLLAEVSWTLMTC